MALGISPDSVAELLPGFDLFPTWSAAMGYITWQRARSVDPTIIDVEPLPPGHPFRSLENVLATPHIGYVARDLYRTFYGDTARNVAAWLDRQTAA